MLIEYDRTICYTTAIEVKRMRGLEQLRDSQVIKFQFNFYIHIWEGCYGKVTQRRWNLLSIDNTARSPKNLTSFPSYIESILS